MLPKYPYFKDISKNDYDAYMHYYSKHPHPSADYSFAELNTWLSYLEPAKVCSLSKNLLLVYFRDILGSDTDVVNLTTIGNIGELTPEALLFVRNLLIVPRTQLVISEPHLDKIQTMLGDNAQVKYDLGLCDYIYSVKEHSSLADPSYRRIRREINLFKRDNPETDIRLDKIDIHSHRGKVEIINAHHLWDSTFIFGNDPDRAEGNVLANIVAFSEEYNVSALIGKIDDEPQYIYIFSYLNNGGKKYINIHHARSGYKFKNASDYFWHLLSKEMEKEGIDYINFERDANIPGIRRHKELLKPVEIHKMYTVNLSQ